jgi:2-furoate---CoA ligase
VHHPLFAGTDVGSVRKLGFAGAPMTDALLQKLQAAFRPELFVNHYGSSEIYTFTIDQNAAAKPGSAGRAGINQLIRVFDLAPIRPTKSSPPAKKAKSLRLSPAMNRSKATGAAPTPTPLFATAGILPATPD